MDKDAPFKYSPEIKCFRLAFEKASSAMEKKRILSILAVERSYKSVCKALGLNISRYLFTEARIYGRAYGPGADTPNIKIKTLAFTETELQNVVQFVLSSENSTGIAWGEKFFTTTEGQQYTLPNFQRKFDPEELWKKFEKQQEQESQRRKMKRNKFLEIVHAITNSQSTSFAALDNINVRFGTENFANIQKLIEDVAQRFSNGVSQEMKDQLVKLCNDSETFLKHTLPAHLQAESKCAAHCTRFGLADNSCKSSMKPCAHTHDKFCSDCDLPYRLFEELASVIEDGSEQEPLEASKNAEAAAKQFQERLKGLQSRTNYYIAHVIRATHEEKVKLTLLESLKEGECIIIMDWKMKFLPQKHRESMQEYFGKAGITWHGIYLLFKRNGVYTTKFYNDVGDDKEEDGFAELVEKYEIKSFFSCTNSVAVKTMFKEA